MSSNVKIYNIKKTCPACPTIFVGNDSAGASYRFKFRESKLSIFIDEKLANEFEVYSEIKSSCLTFDELKMLLPTFDFVGEDSGIQNSTPFDYDDEAFVRWLESIEKDSSVVFTDKYIMITPKKEE